MSLFYKFSCIIYGSLAYCLLGIYYVNLKVCFQQILLRKCKMNQIEKNFSAMSPNIKEISDVTAYSKYFFGVVFTSFFKYSLTVFFSNLGIKIVAITVKINANIKLHIITEVTEIAQSSSTTPIVIPFSVKPERRWSIIAKTTFAIIQTAKAVKDKLNRVGSAINIASTIYSIQSSIKNDIFLMFSLKSLPVAFSVHNAFSRK